MPHSEPSSTPVTRAHWAERFAPVVLGNLTREYPYAAHHTTAGPDDRALPVELHPAFATLYDWHSSVHMHWLAARLLAFGLPADLEARLTAVLEAHLTPDALRTEASYLRSAPYWERPYGWAWGIRLAAEASVSAVPAIAALAPGFDPFVDAIATLTTRWVENAAHPVRHGVHGNSAFGLLLTLEAARVLGRDELVTTCERTARFWFGEDRDWPFAWERSGQDFLSPGLAEADLMRAVLTPADFARWADGFFGDLGSDEAILGPSRVVDENDAQQVHLFGLDLSRAGAAQRIASTLRVAGDASSAGLAEILDGAGDILLASGLSASVGEEYYSTHWLASFAWDAMDSREGAART